MKKSTNMKETKQRKITDKEFLEMLALAYEENKEILGNEKIDDGIQEAIDDVVDYHHTLIDTKENGLTCIDNMFGNLNFGLSAKIRRSKIKNQLII